jgi:hypothetical protein
MAEEGTDTKPLEESPIEKSETMEAEPTNAENGKAAPETPAEASVTTEEAPAQENSLNVQITEESVPSEVDGGAKPVIEEEQPKPIVEEPNANTAPELNIIPETNGNTVITEIAANETQEITPEDKPEETSTPCPPSKDVLDTALESVAAKPTPIKQSTIIREPGAPDLPPAANTIFILDLMKQRQEKLRRKKKDDIILEMALKMKKEKEEAKRKGRLPNLTYLGGFLGVNKLTSDAGKSPQLHRKAVMDELVAVPSTGESRAMFENQ